ncbi:hypothetical protein PoB_003003900 [Plakobranchus ocellatus]|uniref:Uncharacterized protein n=1 Tax=Plakobranchus ocellatus TaxID=259542 RepID=A0AAV4AAN9_9GAST|nr:hypothetical protein PoB_003003900 [Plakobranchus ocellatus]
MLFKCRSHQGTFISSGPQVFDDLPNLAVLAKPLICPTVNSAGAEHRFTIYNLILSPRTLKVEHKAKSESEAHELMKRLFSCLVCTTSLLAQIFRYNEMVCIL